MNQFDLAAVRWGLVLAMCTLFMGAYLGVQFGRSEDQIKASLKETATASAAFSGNAEKIDAAAQSGWKYLKRSHEHFQGLGAIAIGLVLLVSASWIKPGLKTAAAIRVGLGAFIYPLFWYLAACRAAEMGKHAAKESLELVAQFGAGLFSASALFIFFTVLCFAIWKDKLPSFVFKLKA